MIAVAVPVRDEADVLPRLFAALSRQRGVGRFALCVHLDNCGDASAALVAAQRMGASFDIHATASGAGGEPNAGIARRHAMALAQRVAPEGVLLSTDADCEPAEDWIAATLDALGHADIVAGRIDRAADRPSPTQDRTERYLDRLHVLRRQCDPVPWEAAATHHWTSAASLAMSAATYERIGGMPPLRTGEDAVLIDTAARLGLRTRRDASVVVRTSARRRGRIEGGFASALTAGDDPLHAPIVTHPGDEKWRYTQQATARVVHGTGRYAALARRLALPLAEVRQVAAECANGEAFAARIVGAPRGGMRHVVLGDAERVLATLEAAPLRRAA